MNSRAVKKITKRVRYGDLRVRREREKKIG